MTEVEIQALIDKSIERSKWLLAAERIWWNWDEFHPEVRRRFIAPTADKSRDYWRAWLEPREFGKLVLEVKTGAPYAVDDQIDLDALIVGPLYAFKEPK